jgi:unsaturated rhamnogalacturonyl hydrolase
VSAPVTTLRYLDQDVVQRVLSGVLALDLDADYWERQGAMMALLHSDHPRGEETVRRWLDRAVATQTSDGRLCYGGTTNLSFGAFRVMDVAIMKQFVRTASVSAYFANPLVMLYERTGEDRWLTAAERQVEAMLAGPRTSEGFLLMNDAAPEIWIDELYPVCGVLARLGRVRNRPAHTDEAYRHLLLAHRRLVDAGEGLLRHVWLELPNSFPESTFWSRGDGWFLCAAAEVLTVASDHPDAPAVRDMLAGVLDAYLRRQDDSGFFHDFLDDPSTPLEASGTLMFAYAVALAAEHGQVPDRFLPAAVRALDAVAGIVAADGSIGRTVLPPGGPGVPLGSMVLGQSFFLLAAHHLRGTSGLTFGC